MEVYAKAIANGELYSLKKEGGRYYWVDVNSTNGSAPSFYLLVGISYEYIFDFKPHLPYRWYHKYKYLSYFIEGLMLAPFVPLLIVLLICYIKNIKSFKKIKNDLHNLFKMLKENMR